MTAPTIKIRVRPGATPARKPDDRPAQPKHQKGLIQKIIEIVSNDIKHPSGIWKTEKKVIVPESKESWKDWEGQI